MGFNVLIDIVGSVIIGGIILLMMGRINTSIAENTFDRNSELRSHLNLTTTTSILENELRNIGYTADYLTTFDRKNAILLADTSQLRFVYDYDHNRILDTIYYYLGPDSEMVSTPNPNDRYLYKRVNNKTPVRIASGITTFKLDYFNENDTQLSTPVSDRKQIGSFRINLVVASGEKRMDKNLKYKDDYPTEYWRQTRVTARNLIKR